MATANVGESHGRRRLVGYKSSGSQGIGRLDDLLHDRQERRPLGAGQGLTSRLTASRALSATATKLRAIAHLEFHSWQSMP